MVAFVTEAAMLGFGKIQNLVSLAEMRCQKCKKMELTTTPLPKIVICFGGDIMGIAQQTANHSFELVTGTKII